MENKVLATSSHVMRIASISKPLAMTAAARLYEEGKLDLDKGEFINHMDKKVTNIDKR